jgi:hypothetical protein
MERLGIWQVEGVISEGDDIMGVILSVFMKTESGKMKKYIQIPTYPVSAIKHRSCKMTT